MTDLTFARLREQNLPRCKRWHPEGTPPWGLDEWLLALGGEVGEALNVVKKLNRDRDGLAGNTKAREELVEDLGAELADCVIYLDIVLGWEQADVLLAGGDMPTFAAERSARREFDNVEAITSTGTKLGNKLFRAISNVRPYTLAMDCVHAFFAIDRLADHFGIDLEAAVVSKFNATSDRFGFPERL